MRDEKLERIVRQVATGDLSVVQGGILEQIEEAAAERIQAESTVVQAFAFFEELQVEEVLFHFRALAQA